MSLLLTGMTGRSSLKKVIQEQPAPREWSDRKDLKVQQARKDQQDRKGQQVQPEPPAPLDLKVLSVP